MVKGECIRSCSSDTLKWDRSQKDQVDTGVYTPEEVAYREKSRYILSIIPGTICGIVVCAGESIWTPHYTRVIASKLPNDSIPFDPGVRDEA